MRFGRPRARPEPVLPEYGAGALRRVLTVRRSARAKAMRLAVDPRDGAVRLSLPARAPLAHALAWAEGQRGWVERALAALPGPLPIAPGAAIPFEGAPHRIEWRAGPRGVRRGDGALIVGGAQESVGVRVLRWLRQEAAARLEAETRDFAARAGVSVGRVGVGDPRARWGSCSADGDIRYAWRLILAPPPVREATVAHEVAHRLHMHHGPAFHAEVKRLLGRDPAPERTWLRANGAALYWVGRER